MFESSKGSLEKGERPPQEAVTASVKPVISTTSQATQRKSTSVQPQAHIQVFFQLVLAL
jgi:hypothetical protein